MNLNNYELNSYQVTALILPRIDAQREYILQIEIRIKDHFLRFCVGTMARRARSCCACGTNVCMPIWRR
ncbi:hypothetical protein T11_17853 [Trichinella zimbabwensis]|uniref:Uncharacterized protein n=1 Tax=Trichinella zimbabwensis TaxID=268475 RepID=A0A0V1H1J2_9BILA|nr:hypothetical protein T11_17853 [Trichinella zimbabwensis]